MPGIGIGNIDPFADRLTVFVFVVDPYIVVFDLCIKPFFQRQFLFLERTLGYFVIIVFQVLAVRFCAGFEVNDTHSFCPFHR